MGCRPSPVPIYDVGARVGPPIIGGEVRHRIRTKFWAKIHRGLFFSGPNVVPAKKMYVLTSGPIMDLHEAMYVIRTNLRLGGSPPSVPTYRMFLATWHPHHYNHPPRLFNIQCATQTSITSWFWKQFPSDRFRYPDLELISTNHSTPVPCESRHVHPVPSEIPCMIGRFYHPGSSPYGSGWQN